jgi:F0F1-type ATP synthase epsilon subunit
MEEESNKKSTTKNAQSFNVIVSTPSEILWIGLAYSVSSINSEGNFDILPQHANFITITKKSPIIIEASGGVDKKFKFDRAIIYVRSDKVSIYGNL